LFIGCGGKRERSKIISILIGEQSFLIVSGGGNVNKSAAFLLVTKKMLTRNALLMHNRVEVQRLLFHRII
jgi:hypothetical protein